MRRFRLLKDLPGFPTGTIMYINDDEDSNEHKLYVESADVLSGYKVYDSHIMTNEGVGIESISTWLDELPEKLKRWRAHKGENYFYLMNGSAEIGSDAEWNWRCDDDRYNIGNYFKAKDEAQAVAGYLKALTVVRDDAKGFVPDWSDESQKKFVVSFSGHLVEPIGINNGFDGWAPNGVFGLPYFASYGDAQASIDKHEKEWKTIFGIKDEEGE